MKKSFTLIELIVVITIIAVLAAIIAPNAFKAIKKAQISQFSADFKSIKSSAMNYYGDTGNWPDNNNAFSTDPGGVTGWNGPYLSKWPNTPWGTDYNFSKIGLWGWVAMYTSNVNLERIVVFNFPVNAAGEYDKNLRDTLEDIFDDGNINTGYLKNVWGLEWHTVLVSADETPSI